MASEQNTTKNIQSKNHNIEVLKREFSNCFDKNGDFDIEKLRKELWKTEIKFSKESYGMDWLGKSYARLLATDAAKTLIKEDTSWNRKPENKTSENILIKWDNLEVLKHLSHAYYEKIKMIYIDPPYNTWSDGFVYEDDRKFTVSEFQELAGVDEEQAKKILSFVDSKSNSHSAWLTFMYPRLYIARQLLKDDGVIFISIDDNEVAQLKILMNEIFWEENFVEQFIWIKNSTKNNSKTTSTNHEYVLCYAKEKSSVEKKQIFRIKKPWLDEVYSLLEDATNNWLTEEETEKKLKAFYKSRPDLKWISQYDKVEKKNEAPEAPMHLQAYTTDNASAPLASWQWPMYDVIHPKTGRPCICPSTGWRYTRTTMEEHLKNWLIYFYEDETKVPRFKRFLNTVENEIIKSSFENFTDGKKELLRLFDFNPFENPKPTTLLTKFLNITTDTDIILDFFAWSGSMWDAIMQINKQDNKKRTFILVQLDELTNEKSDARKRWFRSVFEITKERLVRAGKKIGDTSGFKIFETQPIWEDYQISLKEFDPQQKLFNESKLSDDDIQTLLTTWKTYDNIRLTEDLGGVDLDGYRGYYGAGKLYLMDKWFTTKNLKALIEKIDRNADFHPATIIVFWYNFESKMLREIAENVASYTNKKQLEIDFITRY